MTSEALIALITLTFLEIILGVDNVIFISILSGKLPKDQQKLARRYGLIAAMGMRLLLLFSINWVAQLTAPLFTAVGFEISGRDLILIGGGLFLLAKATYEIHDKLEGEHHEGAKAVASFGAVIGQVMVLDLVFSLDSVITAIGMADDISIMATAVVLAVRSRYWRSRSSCSSACRSWPKGSTSTSPRGTSTSRWASRSSWR
jgi:predicted tellurium resistance membrane protein TerC